MNNKALFISIAKVSGIIAIVAASLIISYWLGYETGEMIGSWREPVNTGHAILRHIVRLFLGAFSVAIILTIILSYIFLLCVYTPMLQLNMIYRDRNTNEDMCQMF